MPVDLAELYEAHSKALLLAAYAVSHHWEEAEDAVQAVFTKYAANPPEELNYGRLAYGVKYAVYNAWRQKYGTRYENGQRVGYKAEVVALDDSHDEHSNSTVEDQAIAALYLEAAVTICPQIPTLIDEPPSTHRRNALANVRKRLNRDLEDYMIDAYFGGENHGNDAARRTYYRTEEQECEHCGKSFRTAYADQRFCDAPACRRAKLNAKNRRAYARRRTQA